LTELLSTISVLTEVRYQLTLALPERRISHCWWDMEDLERPTSGRPSDGPCITSSSRAGDEEYTREDVLRLFFREGGGADADKPPIETNLSVKLEITPGESVKHALSTRGFKPGRYILERSASVGKIVPTPHDVILPPVSLKGPNLREVSDPEGFIEEFLLPASTSTFFMFHGDRIRDLTAQIDQPVIESIKQILDVTAMNNAVTDLRVVMGQFARSVASSSRNEEQRRLKQGAWDKLDEDEKKQEGIKKEKEGLLEQAEGAVKALEAEQGELLEAAGLFTQFENLEGTKKVLEEERDGVEQSLRSLIDQVPKEILYHTLFKKARQLEHQDESNKLHEEKIEDLKGQKGRLEQLIREGKCPVCKQLYSKDLLTSYKKEILGFDSQIKKEEESIKALDPALEQIKKIVDRFALSKYEPEELKTRLYDYRVRINDKENELNAIKAKLKKFNSAEVRKRAKRIEEEKSRNDREIGRLEGAIKELEHVISQIQKNKQALQKDLVSLGGGGSKILQGQYELAETLHQVFSEAVIELADDKRQEIAKQTGDMLMKVTIKPELFHKTNPIDVDEDFQVRAMNYEGNPLLWTGEASSEREVLAVSFIYGLLRASEREAPVILDTFFGNLDPNQIRNLTANLSTFGSQIVLMTTVTEFLDLIREAPPQFWQHVVRYVFLRNSVRTNFVTQHKVITSLKEAEKEAAEEKREFAVKAIKA
jgi:DNA sulfur modification protein DndD